MFFRGSDFSPVKAEPIDLSLGRTEPPLWASDHAALAAEPARQPPSDPSWSNVQRVIIDTEYAMSNNFAFGGVNTSLVLRRYRP